MKQDSTAFVWGDYMQTSMKVKDDQYNQTL
jgi:hypothetical protein